ALAQRAGRALRASPALASAPRAPATDAVRLQRASLRRASHRARLQAWPAQIAASSLMGAVRRALANAEVATRARPGSVARAETACAMPARAAARLPTAALRELRSRVAVSTEELVRVAQAPCSASAASADSSSGWY